MQTKHKWNLSIWSAMASGIILVLGFVLVVGFKEVLGFSSLAVYNSVITFLALSGVSLFIFSMVLIEIRDRRREQGRL